MLKIIWVIFLTITVLTINSLEHISLNYLFLINQPLRNIIDLPIYMFILFIYLLKLYLDIIILIKRPYN